MEENSRNIPFPIHFQSQFYTQFNFPSFSSVLHILGAFSNSIFVHFNAAFCTLRRYFSYFARLRFMFYFNQSMIVTVQVLTAFLQLKYQNGQNKSPFATHSRAMLVAVSSSVIYYLTSIALLRFHQRRFAVIAHHCLVSSGHVSVASLAYVLLPDWISPFVCAVYVLISASELLCWLYHKLAAEDDDVEFDQTHRFLNSIWRVMGNSSEQLTHRLPI